MQSWFSPRAHTLCALDLKWPSPIGAPGTCTADASATPKEAGTRLCNARLSITASPVQHAPRVGTAGRAHLVVGRVVRALEVVQHALGLGQHEVALLPLPGLRQALPPAVLADPLLQVPRQQVACAASLGGFESQGNTSQPYRTYTKNVQTRLHTMLITRHLSSAAVAAPTNAAEPLRSEQDQF